MTEEHAFLESIKESPGDDDLRLIFADWLEDHDQTQRGQLVRLQVELAQWPHGHPRRDELRERAAVLLAEQGELWLGPWGGAGQFRRGLIHVTCRAAELPGLLAKAGGEAALAWVEGLTLRGSWAEIEPLLSSPWLRHVPALWLGNALGPEAAVGLAALPHLAHLTELDLWNNHIGPEGAVALAASTHLTRLSTLNVSDNFIRTEGAVALAAWSLLARLNVLDLHSNGIGAKGAEAVAASPHLACLTQLNLGYNQIGSEGAMALAASPYLVRLTALNLRGNDIGEKGATALAASPSLARLTSLDLKRNSIGPEGASALAASPHLARLAVLDLEGNRIGPKAEEQLRRRFGSGFQL